MLKMNFISSILFAVVLSNLSSNCKCDNNCYITEEKKHVLQKIFSKTLDDLKNIHENSFADKYYANNGMECKIETSINWIKKCNEQSWADATKPSWSKNQCYRILKCCQDHIKNLQRENYTLEYYQTLDNLSTIAVVLDDVKHFSSNRESLNLQRDIAITIANNVKLINCHSAVNCENLNARTEEFLESIKYNNVPSVQKQLIQCIDQYNFPNKMTPLRQAAFYNRNEIFMLLIDNIFDNNVDREIEARNNLTASALHVAAIYGKTDAVKLLLKYHPNVDVKATDKCQRTALIMAAGNGHVDITNALLEKGANVDARAKYGATALMYTAQSGRVEVAKILLKNHASIEARDEYNNTALLTAARSGKTKVLTLLLENGANIEAANKKNSTALHISAQYGHVDIVRLLLENNANLEARDSFNNTPLIVSAVYGHSEITQVLLEHGAHIEARSVLHGTALAHAAQYGHPEIAEILLQNNADIEAKNKYNWSVLFIAAYYEKVNVVKVLLEHGANVNTVSNDKRSPLIVATIKKNFQCVKYFLERGAKTDISDVFNKTALMYAEENYNSEIITLLKNEIGQ